MVFWKIAEESYEETHRRASLIIRKIWSLATCCQGSVSDLHLSILCKATWMTFRRRDLFRR